MGIFATVKSTSINRPKSTAESILTINKMSTKEGSDEREEGEIIDEFEDIISSDEEFSLRKRIEELEAKNAELEKIENISANYGNSGFDYPKKDSYLGDRYPLISIDISDDEDYPPAPKMSRVSKRRKSIQHSSSRHKIIHTTSSSSHRHRKRSSSPPPAPHYRQSDKVLLSSFHDRISSHNSHTSKRKRKSKKTHSTKTSRKSREQYASESDNEYSVEGFNDNLNYMHHHLYSSDGDRNFTLNREELRILVRSSHRNEQIVPLKDRLIRKKENTNTLNEKGTEDSPPEAVDVEEEIEAPSRNPTSPVDEKPDTEEDLEEQELRILALKSAVLRKHMVRKKRNENVAYSPSDFDEIYKCINDSPSINNIDELEACNSMEISPVPSPKMVLSDDGGIDTQPIDMDIVNSESDCELPTYEKWVPIEQIPLPNTIGDELYVPTPMRYTNECFIDQRGLKPPEVRLQTASISPNNNDSDVDEEELALRALLLSKMNSPKVEKTVKRETRNLVNANTPDSDISLEADVLRNFLINTMKKKTQVNHSSESVLKEAVRRLTGRNASSSPVEIKPTIEKPRVKTADETEIELGQTITDMAKVKIDVDVKPSPIDLEANKTSQTQTSGTIRVKSLKTLLTPQHVDQLEEIVPFHKEVAKENLGTNLSKNLASKKNAPQDTLEKNLEFEKGSSCTVDEVQQDKGVTESEGLVESTLVPQDPGKEVALSMQAKKPTKKATNSTLAKKSLTYVVNPVAISIAKAKAATEQLKNQQKDFETESGSSKIVKATNVCQGTKLSVKKSLETSSDAQNKNLRSEVIVESVTGKEIDDKNTSEEIVLEKQELDVGSTLRDKSEVNNLSNEKIDQKSKSEVTESVQVEEEPSIQTTAASDKNVEDGNEEENRGETVESSDKISNIVVIQDTKTKEKPKIHKDPVGTEEQRNEVLPEVTLTEGKITEAAAVPLTESITVPDLDKQEQDPNDVSESGSVEVVVKSELIADLSSKQNEKVACVIDAVKEQATVINNSAKPEEEENGDHSESASAQTVVPGEDCEPLSSIEPDNDMDKTLVEQPETLGTQLESQNEVDLDTTLNASLSPNPSLVEATEDKLQNDLSEHKQSVKSDVSKVQPNNHKAKQTVNKTKPNSSIPKSALPVQNKNHAVEASQKYVPKPSVQRPSSNSIKIVKPNKIINQQSTNFKRKPIDNHSKPSVPTKKIKLNETNRLITTAEIPKVPKLVIQIGASESESEYSAMSANEIDDNEDSCGARNIFNRSITIGNEYYDIASPISLTMESPCDTPTQVGSPIVSRTQTPQPIVVEKSIVNDYFEAKLEQFLKNVRSKVSETKKSAEDQTLTQIQIPPANCTPLAVRHLPESSQQEYRRLINRMKMLERQKQAKNLQVVLNTTVETSTSDSRVSITANDTKCLVRKVLVKNATAKSPQNSKTPEKTSIRHEKPSDPIKPAKSLQNSNPPTLHDTATKMSKENRLILYEGSYRKTGSSIISNLDKSIELVSVAKEAKMAKLKHEKRLRELREEMENVQRKLQEQQAKITKIYPEIFNSHRAIESLKTRRLKINKAVTALGKSIIGPHYSMNNDQKPIISEKSKKLASEIKIVNNMKIHDVEKWESQNHHHHLTSKEKPSISSCPKDEKLPAQNLIIKQNPTDTKDVPSDQSKTQNEVPKCDSENPVVVVNIPVITEDTQILECNVNATVVPEILSKEADEKVYPTNGHEEALETEKAIGDTDGQAHKLTNMEDEKEETDEQVGCVKLQDYVSPLSHLRGERQINPNGVVCPYQLMGQCDDKDCNYMHLDDENDADE